MAENEAFPVYPGWETVRLIGRGSFGAVYEIRRDVRGHTERAALKYIRIPQNDSDLDELRNDGYDEKSITERFEGYLHDILREYSMMADMKGCSNSVYCDDVRYIQHDDSIGWDIFIKMELLTPLPRAVDTLVPDGQVLRIATDICSALCFCEKRKILHRDIKPANIFMSPDGTYKLGDFGIAKTVEKTTRSTKIGTYNYMAPEVYNNQPYGAKADIYSLGLVLYWLLNERRTPFLPLPPKTPTASMEEDARQRRFKGEAIPAPTYGSPALQRIVLKACAFDPKDRYQTAEEMLRDLQAVNSGTFRPKVDPLPAVRGVDVNAEDDRDNEKNWAERSGEISCIPESLEDETHGIFPSRRKDDEPQPLIDETSDESKEQTQLEKRENKPEMNLPGETVPKLSPNKDFRRIWVGFAIGVGALALLLLFGYFTVHKWEPATCTRPETCSICGKTRGSALGHDYTPATCTTPEICTRCGETLGTANGHDFMTATCTSPATCRRCGETQGTALGHDWAPATCTTPETCRNCSATQGTALGHDWAPATYTEPETCRRCDQTRGSPISRRNEIIENAQAASGRVEDYRIVSDLNVPLYVPDDSSFLSSPFEMYADAAKDTDTPGTCIWIMPKPQKGNGNLGRLAHGTTVTVLAKQNGFYFFVLPDGRAGWAGDGFLTRR